MSMSKDFRTALLWHMDAEDVGVAKLAKGAGVSADVIKKLRTRPGSSTNAETANRIANYFGKDVADFIAMRNAHDTDSLHRLIDQLSEQEQEFLLRQVQGMLIAHE